YVETWPKEFETSEKVLQNLTKDEKRFIELAFPFYEMIVKESTKSVIDGKEYSITSDYFKDSYEQLKSLKELNKDEIKQLYNDLISAHDEFMKYLEDPKVETWYNAQTELMEFIT